jgi:hypothetical protein
MWVAIAVGAVLAGGAAARLAFTGDLAEVGSLLAYQAVLCVSAVVMATTLVVRPSEIGFTDLVVELGEARSDGLRESLANASATQRWRSATGRRRPLTSSTPREVSRSSPTASSS